MLDPIIEDRYAVHRESRLLFALKCIAGAALLGVMVGLIFMALVVMVNW